MVHDNYETLHENNHHSYAETTTSPSPITGPPTTTAAAAGAAVTESMEKQPVTDTTNLTGNPPHSFGRKKSTRKRKRRRRLCCPPTMHACVVTCVPEVSPIPWIFINSACCLWSFFLIIEIQMTIHPRERPHGTQLYLTWNLATTLIWCIEVGLSIWYKPHASSWIRLLEMAVAVFFLMDSVSLIRTYRNHPDDDIAGEFMDAFVSLSAYVYQLTVAIWTLHRQISGQPALPPLSDQILTTCVNTAHQVTTANVRGAAAADFLPKCSAARYEPLP